VQRSALLTSLFLSAASLTFVGCLQDFDQFEPQDTGPAGSGAGQGSSSATGGGGGGGGQAGCSDGMQNGDETGVDCGGSCLLCDGAPCKDAAQCKSNKCAGPASKKTCQAP
jgi:hypothetical protein